MSETDTSPDAPAADATADESAPPTERTARKVRKQVARINTLIREREIVAAEAGQ
ncbi:MAG: hypothetical protein ABIP17_17140 [Ilumatobacteraceae bacterium]